MSKRTQQLSPVQKLMQAASDFLVGFSIFLIIAGLIGTIFVLQDLQENTSQDVRSDASTAEIEYTEVSNCSAEESRTMAICTDEAAISGDMTSCTAQELCEIPTGCQEYPMECTLDSCPIVDTVIICPEKIDDIYYKDTSELDSPRFYLDEELTQEIQESELQTGRYYFYKVIISLQNEIKGATEFDATSFFTGVRINQVHRDADLVRYNMLTAHRDGYTTFVSGRFLAVPNNTMNFTIETIDIDGDIIIPESDYDNNKHLHTFPAQACRNNADLNEDGKVDLRDFSILSRDFFKNGINSVADINCDGLVNILDYSILAANFSVTQ